MLPTLPFNFLVKGVAHLLLSRLEGHETVVDALVETRLIIVHRRWRMIMVMLMLRLMMMLQRRLVVVLRSMIRKWSMEAVVDTPSRERHTSSLYAACGLLIILRMIMVKITWPPACTYRCLWFIGSVILLGLVMYMRWSRLIKSKVTGEGWL
jgi:hypothetical protein